MRSPSPLLLRIAALLSCTSILPAVLAADSPVIDVALQASFNRPPFLLELLETAADEQPICYLPLLNHIASGTFAKDTTDEQLYLHFRKVLEDDGYIINPSALSTFDFALSLHSAAPRIQAHYQFYATSVKSSESGDAGTGCDFSVWENTKQTCYIVSNGEIKKQETERANEYGIRKLDLDRVDGLPSMTSTSTLYADILSPHFGKVYNEWRAAKQDNVAYRLRYKPSIGQGEDPLIVNGYGVELALKRTDYIVIDDRETEGQGTKDDAEKKEAADVKPLSSSELADLGVKAASFVMQSENPLDTLLDISQDFPKHSADLAHYETSEAFGTAYSKNHKLGIPVGLNAVWINGVQAGGATVDAFSLLEQLRRERKLMKGFQDIGFPPAEAISILSHPKIVGTQSDNDAQRYDWRDEEEGGNVILWMNDIEKDKRYTEWPTELEALLQRTYPGQLPAVRRDIQNLIVPTDYTDPKQVILIIEQLKTFVTRRIPLRVGLVPTSLDTAAGVDQGKIVYHLNEVYGLTTVMDYLETSLEEKELASPSEKVFDKTIKDRKVRKGRTVQEFSSVLQSEPLQTQIDSARKYLSRLGSKTGVPPLFINGVAVTRDETWLQIVSNRISTDLRLVQETLFEGNLDADTWIPSLFLTNASPIRNPLLIPEDEKHVTIIDVSKLHKDHGKYLDAMPTLKLADILDPSSENRPNPFYESAILTIFADLNTKSGRKLLVQAIDHANDWHMTEITIVHNSADMTVTQSSAEAIVNAVDAIGWSQAELRQYVTDKIKTYFTGEQHQAHPDDEFASLLEFLDISPGQPVVMIGSRLVGPLPESEGLHASDFETLLGYERKKRMLSVNEALEALELVEKVKTPLDATKLSSLVALSTRSEVPEGVFDNMQGPRTAIFEKWNMNQTTITIGDKSAATIQIVASVDPASEIAQRWIPILKTISELDGVYTCIFLSPTEDIKELPVKRFYRHVLQSKPSFDATGDLKSLHAIFQGIPPETLLTMTMDVPPSWLVAPKISVYDLDNIKLSNLKSGDNVEAIYELEHILIEGHSRDVTMDPPPRGVQLLLGTESNPNFAGTIIMANIGYFQFKANPGVFNLTLQEGRSKEIFSIESAGSKGYEPSIGDETTDISLTSFQGVTLFPRLSRNTGMDEEDVLEPSSNAANDLVTKGTELADALLSKAGIPNARTWDYVSKGVQFGQNILSAAGLTSDTVHVQPHADINIFSVASGHLYERMLNIMMVSVLRHTKKTVKFWFIEQFLSPSFKTALPHLAEHYNFTYSMVTYKWPHWLRAQKEKQRVIWGYKILFLDVLFPLDLDKVIFVDADQIVRTDMWDLVTLDLKGAPYGFTPMCDSRTEMEGFRFWKQGYWKNFLRGLPYHISALYVVDLKKFRQMAAGDRLRQQYHQLSRDPESLSNLDQDLPNHMQMAGLRIHSLPQEWLWCETWCSDEALKEARTIDLCNNPLTKEPKLDRARRQVPEWTELDEEIAGVLKNAGQKRVDAEPVNVVQPPQSLEDAPSSSTSQKDEL